MQQPNEEREKWEYIGHRMMLSSDLQVLCGVSRSSPEAEKPFVASLTDDELEGMATFVLLRMQEADERAKQQAQLNQPAIPYEYRDRQQEYLRLQVPKDERYRSCELYNAEFINDLDEGYETLQGVCITLSRALGYLLEELHYRHGALDPAFMHSLLQNFPRYAFTIEKLSAERKRLPALQALPILKITLTGAQLADLFGGLEVFFDPSDRRALQELLQGKSADRKLVFNGNQNRLVEVFRRLSYNGLLHDSSSVIRDWLCGHFAYRSKAGVADLSRNSVWDILSKAKGEPAFKSRICMFDWLPYKTQAVLKRTMQNARH